ncbi:hypothetical protein O4N82_21920 [Vibrio parahaemolyticus]|uniref:hypothetical protein n=1 Tax=Vibrio parahaemolyticus TaxID=670 RepID=UPI0022B47A1A|nr:hypothetical protein [Vibrio parahaemolyticus]EGU0149960.1 hypothetical protein [Vibrio parahaemolyticus]MCZ6381937.1 hypothetical protein [Vibrio parahaemolyticus]MCZ6404375.1 hypothetical protein [Vibrio parahaemolyticus]
MNSNTNNSSIAALVDAANQKKNTDKGRKALAATQAINNKSVVVTHKKDVEREDKGKRRNVYFNAKALKNLKHIEDNDEVGMSAAVQAALYLLANTSDKKREAVYRELKIQCCFDK